MKITKIIVGELEENCYILTKNNDTLIIDPGSEASKIIKHIKGNVIGIIITHYHFDHIGALDELKEKYDVPIYDYKTLGYHELSNFTFEIIATKGHTKDSITAFFQEENLMFCGDFVFKGSIGRTDLPSGNFKDMKDSIQLLLTYNEDIKLYPGHYEETTLKEEKEFLLKLIAQ